MQTTSFLKGLAIIISNYNENIAIAESTSCLRQFLLLFFYLINHPNTPSRIPQWSNGLPRYIFKTRAQLANFLDKRVHLPLWYEAENYLTSPTQWGPFVWDMLYAMVNLYIPERHEKFHQFLLLLPFVLPCHKCAQKFLNLLLIKQKEYRKIRSAYHLYHYISHLHKIVNTHKIHTSNNDILIPLDRQVKSHLPYFHLRDKLRKQISQVEQNRIN